MTNQREDSMRATMITENAYGLCDAHLAAWRNGGNNVDAWPIAPDDPEHFGAECSDCAESYTYKGHIRFWCMTCEDWTSYADEGDTVRCFGCGVDRPITDLVESVGALD